MGLPQLGEDKATSQQMFTCDLLKIEFRGPQHEHFRVVDLPGLSRSKPASEAAIVTLILNQLCQFLARPPKTICSLSKTWRGSIYRTRGASFRTKVEASCVFN